MKNKTASTPNRQAAGLHLLLLMILVLSVAACASTRGPSLILGDHPLVDRIWDVKQQTFIDHTELLQQLLTKEYLLLGERHDNMAHHRHQAWVIRQLYQARIKAGVAFEMIDDRQGNLLARHRITTAAQMIAILNQYKTHWDYEQRYAEVFADVLAAHYPVIPANLNRDRLKQITARGEAKLPRAYRKLLSQAALNDGQMDSLRQEIKSSHCNMLGDKMAAKLVLSQRVRDAVMAHSLTKIQSPVKVFIAGAGHVRKDRGVPFYLAKFKKGAKIAALGFTEVAAGQNKPGDYAKRWGGEQLPFDYIWFTPSVERKDLCAGFKRHMKQSTRAGQKLP